MFLPPSNLYQYILENPLRSEKKVLQLYVYDPYYSPIYYYLFIVLMSKKKYGKLYRLLQEGTFLLPHVFFIKELLLFLLTFYSKNEKKVLHFLLKEIFPLLQKDNDCEFLFYCCSHYFRKSSKIQEAYFYSSYLLKRNQQTSIPFFVLAQHFLILHSLKKGHEIRSLFENYLNKNDHFPDSLKQFIFFNYYDSFHLSLEDDSALIFQKIKRYFQRFTLEKQNKTSFFHKRKKGFFKIAKKIVILILLIAIILTIIKFL